MKEISLNILDIVQNSVKAGASCIEITIDEDDTRLAFSVQDNGCGMTAEFLKQVTSPFSTTRTTRKVGLGIPLLKMSAEMTGGSFSISSKSEKEYEDHGTITRAVFRKDNIDCVPLGDIVGTVCTLINGIGKEDYLFLHRLPHGEVRLSTAEMREMLGEEVPLGSPEIVGWARDYLTEAYQSVIK